MNSTPRIILCVDDDPDDRDMVCYTIGEIDPSIEVKHAEDGHEALEYLNKAKTGQRLPCLVILDINMPKMDGKQTLAEIKKDNELKKLPVVIFSTSSNPLDKIYCERYGVEMVTKPFNMSGIKKEIGKLLSYCD
ncbi:MAG TPA: response regulator [Chitinophagaceae bacterium]|jgi:CheY-like chemotaxis protein|nr:response regulator [Chitinophagaceae bacterium]